MPWTIPRPINDGYALEPVDPVLRTDMEFGSPRTRLRTQANLDHVTLTWIFTAAEMGDFRTWWESDIARGASWFEMELVICSTCMGGSLSSPRSTVPVIRRNVPRAGPAGWLVRPTTRPAAP